MQLTLIRTTGDILYFIIVLMIFIVCAALGIQFLYVNYQDEWRVKEDDFGGICIVAHCISLSPPSPICIK